MFGYENLLVCDGAAIPANVGVNPSLTITALAEHAMSHVPPAPAAPQAPAPGAEALAGDRGGRDARRAGRVARAQPPAIAGRITSTSLSPTAVSSPSSTRTSSSLRYTLT